MLPERRSIRFTPRENGVLFGRCNVVDASHDLVFALRTLQLRQKTLFLVQCKNKNMPRKKTYKIVALTANWVTAIADNICENVETFDISIGPKYITFACKTATLVMKSV